MRSLGGLLLLLHLQYIDSWHRLTRAGRLRQPLSTPVLERSARIVLLNSSGTPLIPHVLSDLGNNDVLGLVEEPPRRLDGQCAVSEVVI